MAAIESARIVIEVQAGLTPENPNPELTCRWVFPSSRWNTVDALKQGELLATFNGEAQGYAGALMLQPDRVNWVRTEWLYL